MNDQHNDPEEILKDSPKYPERAADVPAQQAFINGVTITPSAIMTYAGPGMMNSGGGLSMFMNLSAPSACSTQSMAGSEKNCTQCGTVNPARAKFCTECGCQLGETKQS